MIKRIKAVFVAFVVIAIALSCSLTAYADGTVTYVGGAEKYIFEPGSEYSPTDLFDGFKNVFPGEKRTQRVEVRNNYDADKRIDIYMRSLGAVEGSEEFLSQLTLTVTMLEDTKIFDAKADQKAGLEGWVLVGSLLKGGSTTLDLTLNVPETLGNEFQNAVGELQWQFKVEEFDIEPDDPAPPTGDSGVVMWIFASATCFIVMLYIILMARRRRTEEEQA